MNVYEMNAFVKAIFDERGPIARKFGPDYNVRPGQVRLAQQVAYMRPRGKNLLAEAPTGTGKTLSTLIPSIVSLKDPDSDISKVVVGTANIALQEQLIKKDLPFLRDSICPDLTFGLLKGRGNYLCRQAFKEAQNKAPHHPEIKMLENWLKTTEKGDKSELQTLVALWPQVSTTAENCLGKKCVFHEHCYAKKAQKETFGADIIVTNYHILLLMGDQFPQHELLICDEGHEITNIARNVLGFTITQGNLEWMKSRMVNLGLKRASLIMEGALEDLYNYCDWFLGPKRTERRIETENDLPDLDNLRNALQLLAADLNDVCVDALDAGDDVELGHRAKDFKRVASLLRKLDKLETCDEKNVYWIERVEKRSPKRQPEKQLQIQMRPIEVQEDLQSLLYKNRSKSKKGSFKSLDDTELEVEDPQAPEEKVKKTVVVLSATIQTNDGFGFTGTELGLNNGDTECLAVESPFNLPEQGTLIIPETMPSLPRYPVQQGEQEAYMDQLVDHFIKFVELCDGRILALFTSWSALNQVHMRLEANPKFKIPLFKQGDAPRTTLVADFRKLSDGILMGVDSFWTGIDIPGMKGLFIDKLPFPVPSSPLFAAMSQLCESRGGHPFFELSLPLATLKLRQGVGRLIRRMDDKGYAMIADRRLLDKGYGDSVIEALPEFTFKRQIE